MASCEQFIIVSNFFAPSRTSLSADLLFLFKYEFRKLREILSKMLLKISNSSALKSIFSCKVIIKLP